MKHLSVVITRILSGKRCLRPGHFAAPESSPKGSGPNRPVRSGFSPAALTCNANRGERAARRRAYSEACSGKLSATTHPFPPAKRETGGGNRKSESMSNELHRRILYYIFPPLSQFCCAMNVIGGRGKRERGRKKTGLGRTDRGKTYQPPKNNRDSTFGKKYRPRPKIQV